MLVIAKNSWFRISKRSNIVRRNKAMIFLNLPSDCITQLLTEWLTLKDLGQMHTAVAGSEDAGAFVQELTRKECVFNGGDWNSKFTGFYRWVLRYSVNLRRIHLSSNSLTMIEVQRLVQLQQDHMQELVVDYVDKDIEEELTHSLSESSSLKSLHILGMQASSSVVCVFFKRIANPWKILVISLCYCSGVTFDVLVCIAEKCVNVQKLQLDNCPNIEDCCVEDTIGFKELKELSLMSCPSLGDQTLHFITRYCSKLTSLELSYIPITDNGISLLATSLHNLRQLKVEMDDRESACTTKGIQQLVEVSPRLEVLDLDCDGCYQDVLNAIIKSCPNFHSLILYERSDTGGLSDREIKEFTDKTPKLQKCSRYFSLES